MQAVILAAGDGGRLRPDTDTTPKPLLPLGGRPIIAHVIDALAGAGVSDAVIVTGYRGPEIRGALGESVGGVRLRYVHNEAFEEGNARSLWAAREHLSGPFLLTMADHVAEPALAQRVADRADGRCRLGVERTARGDARATEATRVRVEGELVVDLGKMLANWNALDTGLFWCTRRVFDALDRAGRGGELGTVFATLARAGELDAADVTGCRWLDIDTPEDLLQARSMFEAHGRVA